MTPRLETARLLLGSCFPGDCGAVRSPIRVTESNALTCGKALPIRTARIRIWNGDKTYADQKQAVKPDSSGAGVTFGLPTEAPDKSASVVCVEIADAVARVAPAANKQARYEAAASCMKCTIVALAGLLPFPLAPLHAEGFAAERAQGLALGRLTSVPTFTNSNQSYENHSLRHSCDDLQRRVMPGCGTHPTIQLDRRPGGFQGVVFTWSSFYRANQRPPVV